VRLGGYDVYLNVAGGYRVSEPAADLAVAAALVSSLTGAILPADAVFYGEIGLSGATRPVNQTQARLKEAEKLGFARAFVPAGGREGARGQLEIREIADLAELVATLAAKRPDARAKAV
jgi:DNA repair protein RadA/Sms